MCSHSTEDDTLVARNMLRDLTPCDDFDETARRVGFIPASSDVDQIEHHQSHIRCSAVEPLSEVIADLSTTCGRLTAALCTPDDSGPLPEEAVDHFVKVSHFAAFAVIMQLVDHGYLKVGAP